MRRNHYSVDRKRSKLLWPRWSFRRPQAGIRGLLVVPARATRWGHLRRRRHHRCQRPFCACVRRPAPAAPYRFRPVAGCSGDLAMTAAIINAAITSRMATRAFTRSRCACRWSKFWRWPAARPSGSNCQPWKVYDAGKGASRDALVEKVCTLHDAMRTDAALAQYTEEYDYYPQLVQSLHRPPPRKRLGSVWTAYNRRGDRTRCTSNRSATTGSSTRPWV